MKRTLPDLKYRAKMKSNSIYSPFLLFYGTRLVAEESENSHLGYAPAAQLSASFPWNLEPLILAHKYAFGEASSAETGNERLYLR